MAKLLPDFSAEIHKTIGFRTEIEVLRWLQQTLPDGYTVFHAVDWHSLHEGRDSHGEIDLIVMNRAGDLLLIEVKSGPICIRDGTVFKAYGSSERDVTTQLKVQYAAMRKLLQQAGLKVRRLCNCLLLPEFRIDRTPVVSIPQARIFDAEDYPQLSARIQDLLPTGEDDGLADQVKAFLLNHLSVSPDVSVLQGQLRDTATRLSDGLATWVPRLQVPSGMFRIQATAGSGKTQLALTLLQNAIQRGMRALYVCFNRPLADHMSRLMAGKVRATTFHSLCIDGLGGRPDHYQSSTFDSAVKSYLDSSRVTQTDLDLLIIDEAQDFEPDWIDGLQKRLDPQGTLYVLEDPDQSLYVRSPFELPEAVSIRCQDNFRTPRQVCNVINAMALSSQPLRARSAWSGEIPEILLYDTSTDDLIKKTSQAVERHLARGVDVSQIAVISMRGHAHSEIIKCTELAGQTVRCFTGEYTDNGLPVWTDGALLVESVYRFKGQSAAAVIITEADFEHLTTHERMRLFVGMTRAWLSVSLVMTPRTEKLLMSALSQ
ncbi:AAA family ATPase [Laribacter hongkongensis]|uniref:AAA family ATPase n=1 Tax=Laribacter hongkongensis TaxID=168471 RepID=UPI001EFD024B|nr:nuclease-related domain-containing DEAD/DEAH box helicase [Laribacter hongkongensis]MCG9107520.1 AAA family ATPase [Laribacter hongkongensis]